MIEPDRLISPTKTTPAEEAFERALRPKHLDEYVGQQKIRDQLDIFIAAARARKKHWTMCFCSALPAWAKPHWPISWPVKWA
jgi:Holliday junction resolvasome RuvABC ATP-dependent DNA helicase subunit